VEESQDTRVLPGKVGAVARTLAASSTTSPARAAPAAGREERCAAGASGASRALGLLATSFLSKNGWRGVDTAEGVRNTSPSSDTSRAGSVWPGGCSSASWAEVPPLPCSSSTSPGSSQSLPSSLDTSTELSEATELSAIVRLCTFLGPGLVQERRPRREGGGGETMVRSGTGPAGTLSSTLQGVDLRAPPGSNSKVWLRRRCSGSCSSLAAPTT